MEKLTVEAVANKVSDLPLKTILSITSDIAKKTKKKRIKSGTASFKKYCNMIAENLLKETNRPVLEKVLNEL